jgi:hypothetical protein
MEVLQTSNDAAFTATSEDEHAVSKATEGPVKSKTYDARPDATEGKVAVAANDDAVDDSELSDVINPVSSIKS